MAENTQFDAYEFPTLSLGYDKSTRDLEASPRIVRGQNVLATVGGKLIKRPGTRLIANTGLNKRIDRLKVYETLDTPTRIYILASAYDSGSGTWALYYNRLDGGSPGWTSAGTLRDVNASTRPHEIVISRGLAFIKGFPGPSGDKYGTVIFDGTGTPSLTFWGLPAPTVAARLGGVVGTLSSAVTSSATTWTIPTDPGFPAAPFNLQCGDETVTVTAKAGAGPVNLTVTRAVGGTTATAHNSGAEVLYKNWNASSLPVTVRVRWRYCYAWKSKTGHISCRSPIEVNPDKRPSDTGGFTNLRPKIEVQGHADTTNVPKIVIYRSTDGGGKYMKLAEVTNTGAGAITVEDNFLTSNGGNLDPLPDSKLDASSIAPSLETNQPPPTVLAPKILGTDQPAASTRIAYFAGRLWYAIGNVLFFSGDEEILSGVPEESWPIGIDGCFYRFQHPIVNLDATGEALYISTLKETHWIRGNSRNTFQVNKLFGELGCAPSARAMRTIGNTLAWVTHDYRVASARGADIRLLTQPLFDDIVSRLSTNTEIELGYFAELDKEYVIVQLIDKADTTNTRQWLYDIQQSTDTNPFWQAPWTIRASVHVSDRIRENDTRRYLCFWMWDGSNGQLAYFDSTEQNVGDAMPAGTTAYAYSVTFNLMPVPAGNHVNLLRRPMVHTPLHAVQLDRTTFLGDTDPTVRVYIDDVFTTPITPSSTSVPTRRAQSLGYKTTLFHFNRVCQRVSIEISDTANFNRAEFQGLTAVFRPDEGA